VNRLTKRFQDLKQADRKAFIAYICAGDPNLDATVEQVCAFAEAGVDVVELGIPYSDPMADGPVNQAAGERALAAGCSVCGVLDAVRHIRERCDIPIVFFTYINPILAYGVEAFARDAVAAGADAVLPLDLPPEQDPELLATLREAGLANICLSAPNSKPERKRFLAESSQGFLYYVCRLGVTGERAQLPTDLAEQVATLQQSGDVPVCIGFGISSPEQATLAAQAGDGVIVGSHLVDMIAQGSSVQQVAARAGELAAAVHAV
jgi:tryptophan synthase alpha chain